MTPSISVIIPSYNYAGYVGLAIESVLNGTFGDFEIVVVDDGSTDRTAEVVAGYRDERVHYLHQENRGLPAARNTGIRAARGKILAFLDADDRFHARKLAEHASFLEKRPEVGLSYNARYLTDRAGNILFLQRVPPVVALKDLVAGYPITPSDVVVRREWAERVGLFDESFVLNSEDLNFHLRLAMAGCKFAGMDQALGYRQIHTERFFRNIPGKLETYLRALNTAFDAPGCPPEVLALREKAYANHYLAWGFQAAAQGEGELGRECFRTVVRLDSTVLERGGKQVAEFFVHAGTRDGGEHEPRLRRAFAHLPEEMAPIARWQEWAVAQGYLKRGLLDRLWGRSEAGWAHIDQAAAQGARLDAALIHLLVDQLVGFEAERGGEAARRALEDLSLALKKVGMQADVRRLGGSYAISEAFKDFRRGRYTRVPGGILRAAWWNPAYLRDRGVISILARSMAGMVGGISPRREDLPRTRQL